MCDKPHNYTVLTEDRTEVRYCGTGRDDTIAAMVSLRTTAEHESGAPDSNGPGSAYCSEESVQAEDDAIAAWDHMEWQSREASALARQGGQVPRRPQRHPRAVRIPDGLEAWYADRARTQERPVNAIIVEALEAFRLSATTPRAAAARSATPAAGRLSHRHG